MFQIFFGVFHQPAQNENSNKHESVFLDFQYLFEPIDDTRTEKLLTSVLFYSEDVQSPPDDIDRTKTSVCELYLSYSTMHEFQHHRIVYGRVNGSIPLCMYSNTTVLCMGQFYCANIPTSPYCVWALEWAWNIGVVNGSIVYGNSIVYVLQYHIRVTYEYIGISFVALLELTPIPRLELCAAVLMDY